MGRKVPYIFILVILATAVFMATQTASADDLQKKLNSGSVNPSTAPTLELGIVNIDGGKVKKVFELYNGDAEDLVLKGAFTSCACTNASIETPDGTLSRPFGMSIPTNWFKVIKPGERFKVHVEFDPAFHGKDGTGVFQRDVYLITSASPNENFSSSLPMIRHGSVSKLRLKGVVVTAEEYSVQQFVPRPGKTAGDFRFSATVLDAGIVSQSGPVVKFTVPFLYEGNGPVKVTGTPTSCACVRASISKTILNPGEEGTLTIEFDPNYHKEPEGRFFKDIVILTEPPQPEEVQIRLWAEVDLDLGPQAYKFKEHDD
ncbi:DUF1573 domain-containing protein [bacterium]|nr:DUF1573 domain-containing protein [bacterium]